MGNFYTNYTLKGPSPEAVAEFLKGRSAIITPVSKDSVVVFDEESESQETGKINELAEKVSRSLCCPVLAVLNHDDDILVYALYQNGTRVDEYCSAPGYFSGKDEEPSGGDAARLCEAFGSSNVDAVQESLHPAERYTFAVEQHDALVAALGISEYAVGAGFMYISSGELPVDLSEEDLLKVE